MSAYDDEWDALARGEPRSRVLIYQGGRLIGTMPPGFDGRAQSMSPLYDSRPGDFKERPDGELDASWTLGPGDFMAMRGFSPMRDATPAEPKEIEGDQ